MSIRFGTGGSGKPSVKPLSGNPLTKGWQKLRYLDLSVVVAFLTTAEFINSMNCYF